MRHWGLPGFGMVLAAAFLTACAGNPVGPMPTATTRTSFDKELKQRDLLYVSNANGTVSVYRYWQRTLVTVLTQFTRPLGECVDQSGRVYIVDYQAQNVTEFAHGGTKSLRVLSDAPYTPYGCSVAPSNGNLAVANAAYGYYGKGNIAIYSHASGKPELLSGSYYNDQFTACAYDDHGDLLVTSTYGYLDYYTHFYYLPKGASQLIAMDLTAPGRSSGWGYVQGVAWDGKYWVVQSYDGLYRYAINIKSTYVDMMELSGGDGEAGPVAIYRKDSKAKGTQAVAGTGSNGDSAVEFWNYPAAGNPIHDITQDLDAPFGVAIRLGSQE
jgi:hypothetical protein